MPANTFGRQVILPLTNSSGGGVIAGDVVILNTAANDSFTTTTAAASTALVGVAQETIASAAVGRVLISGYAPLVNVNASVTRGNYGGTHTVAKQAASLGASRIAGSFCQFLTGGTTPDAVIWATDLGGGSGMSATIFDAKGDIIAATAADTASRLAISGTNGKVLTEASGEATGLKWDTPWLTETLLGTTTQGGSTEIPTTSTYWAKQVTPASTKPITAIRAWVRGNATHIGGPMAAIYDDNAGAPGKLVAFTGMPAVLYGPTMSTVFRVLSIPINYTPVASTAIWIVFGRVNNSTNPALDIAYVAATGTDRRIAGTTTLTDGGWGASTTNDYSICAVQRG